MPIGLQAGLWGLLGASALVLGAALAYLLRLPRRVTSGVLAFGCGVLISAVAYDLLAEGFKLGGFAPILGGALAGSVIYTIANWLVTHHGGRRRRRRASGPSADGESSGTAIAIGALLDGIPESLVLGVGLVAGGAISMPMLVAILLSNLPEGMSSAADMRRAGRGKAYVFGVWVGVALLSGLAAGLGATVFSNASPQTLAAVNAVAAGALLTMIVDTMVPEALRGQGGATGLLVVLGLLSAFALR
ncbi:ZIP family metal transporter [Bordetella petrii]|uniref:ZIP family metal transporter n=1 Tax=Bordetella petrii TaxID=94624 RepID=UPI001E2ED436|nr:ZIP family zinc transporter [Bordetella petrii]MCD0501782.1 ZIP family zinc transporter [Bordetella petrii]